MSIILGRPFLAIRRALVDTHDGKVTMRVQEQEIKFSVYDAIKYKAKSEECYVLRILDEALIDLLSSKAMIQEHDAEDNREITYLDIDETMTHSWKRVYEILDIEASEHK